MTHGPDVVFEPLRGLTVRTVGASVISAAAGRVFDTLGATVVCDGAADDLARSRRLVDVLRVGQARGSDDAGHIWAGMLAGKRVDEDVVVVDLDAMGGVSTAGLEIDTYLGLAERANRRIWVTISAYGLSGPKAGQSGSELSGLASGGVVAYTTDSSGQPVVPAGPQASFTTAHVAVAAALHALSLSAQADRRVHMDVSMQESMVVTSAMLEVSHHLAGLAGVEGAGRYGPPRGLVPCRDGLVYLSILEDRHWVGLRRAMGEPEWARDITTLQAAQAASDVVRSQIAGWLSGWDKRELVGLLQAEGVPATAVNSCRELLDDPDLSARGFFEEIECRGRVHRPRGPFVVDDDTSPGRGVRSAETPIGSLHGAVVADLSHVLAGPLATSWLGTMGADVWKLEDPLSPDLYRRLGPFFAGGEEPPTEAAVELSGYFAAVNYSKRSVRGAMSHDDHAFRRLLRRADVVVENQSTDRRERLGIDFGSLRRENEDAVLVSSSGFGRTTSSAGYRAFGSNIHSHAGLVDATRGADGQPCNIGTAWADPLTAVWMVILVAAVRVGRVRGISFDLSMTEVVCYQQMAGLIATDGGERPDGNSHAPHLIVRCLDRWVLIELDGQAPTPEPCASPATWGEAAVDTVDAVVGWASTVSSDHLIRVMSEQEIRCTPVEDGRSLVADEHLRARGLFQYLEHPTRGVQAVLGLPWREAGKPPFQLSRAPLLGEHSEELVDSDVATRQMEQSQ